MGLDLVELVMRVEEEYGIEIGDDEAAQISTCGQLNGYLMLKLDIQPAKRCLSSATFYRMRRSLVDLSGKPRREIAPKTPMRQILPLRRRRESWRQLSQNCGFNLPELVLPEALNLLVFSGFFGLWLTALGFAIGNSVWAWGFFFAGFAYLPLILRITKPLAIRFPESCQTVGSATKIAMFSTLESASARPVSLKAEELWQNLQVIIADELGVSIERVTPDAHFIFDLGAD